MIKKIDSFVCIMKITNSCACALGIKVYNFGFRMGKTSVGNVRLIKLAFFFFFFFFLLNKKTSG